MNVRTLGVTLLLATTLISGCLSGSEDPTGDEGPAEAPLQEWFPGDVQWDTSGRYSSTLEPGPYGVLPVERHDFESHDGTRIAVAVWRPDVPQGVQVPVILKSSPYFGWLGLVADGDPTTAGIEQLSLHEEEFYVKNFVKAGYAYARMAVRGTAESGGCMEFFGMNEQKDIDMAVTLLGTQEWSNGNVGMIGVSYDGTTPWIAASFGNPHLRTIVPVSGLTDVAGLMYRNGTSEQRGLFMHAGLYWGGFGVTDGALFGGLEDQVCQEVLVGAATNPYTAITGDRTTPAPIDGYWEDRDWREPVKENYDGSVLFVHGLQDWNVEATMGYPYLAELEKQGIRVKHLLGQWGHDWPDRASRGDNTVRWDWAEMLYRWFEHELREDDTVHTGPGAHVQDNRNDWRTEDTWPPLDIEWRTWYLGDGILSQSPTDPGSAYLAVDPDMFNPYDVNALPEDAPVTTVLKFQMDRDPNELRFSGLPRLHIKATPHTPEGGQIYAELVKTTTSSGLSTPEHLAHAVMDLRYHAGGNERQDLVPGEPVTAMMEFFPADVAIGPDDLLELRVAATTPLWYNRIPSHAVDPMEIHWGDQASRLILPVLDRPDIKGNYPGQPGSR